MKTNGDILREHADQAGIPLRTLKQVKAGLTQARKNKCEDSMARLMIKFARMTPEARAYLESTYVQGT